MNLGLRKYTIMEAVFRYIYKNGVFKITMRKIAKEANVSLGTLYYYYKTEENILKEFMCFLYNTQLHDIEQRVRNEGSPKQKLEGVFEAAEFFLVKRKKLSVVLVDFWPLAKRNPALKKILHNYDKIYSQKIEAIIEEGIKTGDFNNIDKTLIPDIISFFLKGVGLHKYNEPLNPKKLEKHFGIFRENLIRLIVKEQDEPPRTNRSD